MIRGSLLRKRTRAVHHLHNLLNAVPIQLHRAMEALWVKSSTPPDRVVTQTPIGYGGIYPISMCFRYKIGMSVTSDSNQQCALVVVIYRLYVVLKF